MIAGTPTAIELPGTSHKTTALAPIITLSPIVMGPSSFAPAPISTLFPIIGADRSSILRNPIVTPFLMRQLSPNLA